MILVEWNDFKLSDSFWGEIRNLMLSYILNFGLVNFMRCGYGIIVNVRKHFYLQEIDAEIFRDGMSYL